VSIAGSIYRYQFFNFNFEIIYMKKVHKAYAMLGIIKRNFKYISINNFILR